MPTNNTEDSELRHKIALQIVKARVPGYKMTKGEWNEEAHLVPDVYIDNLMQLITQRELKARLDEHKHLDTDDDGYIWYVNGEKEIHRDDRIAELTAQLKQKEK